MQRSSCVLLCVFLSLLNQEARNVKKKESEETVKNFLFIPTTTVINAKFESLWDFLQSLQLIVIAIVMKLVFILIICRVSFTLLFVLTFLSLSSSLGMSMNIWIVSLMTSMIFLLLKEMMSTGCWQYMFLSLTDLTCFVFQFLDGSSRCSTNDASRIEWKILLEVLLFDLSTSTVTTQ